MLQIDEITERIHQWIVGYFPLAKERDIGPSDSLFESGIVDSLGTLDIFLFLEQKLGLVSRTKKWWLIILNRSSRLPTLSA